MAEQLIEPKKFRQLFLDDGAVEAKKGVTQKVRPPQKCGPLIRGGVQSRCSPQWNPDKNQWEWWYMGEHIGYATSTDGQDWQLPRLGLYEWQGSKDNNIACPPGVAAERLYHIVRDEKDGDPQRRYKGLFGVSGRQPVVSPDGFKWTKVETAPIPSQDESQFTYDPYTEEFLLLVKQQTQWGRSVFLSTSADFRDFSEPQLVFCSDEIDWENCRQRVRQVVRDPAFITPPIVDDEDYFAEIYNMAVLPYQGLYIGFPTVFNPFGAIPPPHTNFTRINQIELAVSRDLYHWQRVGERGVFLGLDPWDGKNYGTSQLLMAGQPVVRSDGEIWCYYNALRLPGDAAMYQKYNRSKELFRLGVRPEHFEDSGALSLAKLPPDRFACLEADESGTIITKPFVLQGEDVYINADASWGGIYTEIIDAESQKPHQGFWVPGEHPPPFNDDRTRAKVAWKYPHDMVFDRPVRLKFYLHQARLYSFWLE